MEPETDAGRHFIVRKVSTNEQAANARVAFMCPDDYLCFYQNDNANVRMRSGGIIEDWRLAVDDSLPKGTIAIGGPERSRLGLVIGDIVRVSK